MKWVWLYFFFFVPVCAFPGVRLLPKRLSSTIMLMSQKTVWKIKTKTDGLWKGEYHLPLQLLWFKVSLLAASGVGCSIFHIPPPILGKILYTLTTWHISILIKTKLPHSANMLMTKVHWFNIYFLPSKKWTFCKLFFDDILLSSIQSTTHTHAHKLVVLKHGTSVTGNSRNEKLAWASYLGLGSLGLCHRSEYLCLLISPLC